MVAGSTTQACGPALNSSLINLGGVWAFIRQYRVCAWFAGADSDEGARSALHLADHRKHGPSEISSGFHQLICTGRFKLVPGTITPQHAKAAHSDRVRA